jgi:hypothetical protein
MYECNYKNLVSISSANNQTYEYLYLNMQTNTQARDQYTSMRNTSMLLHIPFLKKILSFQFI